MARIKTGMAQLLVEGGEPERNLARAESLLREAAAHGCHICVLPETIDFAWTHPSAIHEAQPVPGVYSAKLCSLALELKMWICAGLTEKVSETRRYNTAILISDAGVIVEQYHKINLLEVEFPFYEVGDHLRVVDTPFGKIGVNICADNYTDSLHLGHALARMGAQIILSPSSWTVDYSVTEADEPYHEKWSKPMRTLTSLHGIVMVMVTSVGYIVGGPYEGKKMVGKSLAMGPQGILAEGMFNEFAGELVVAEFEVPVRTLKGVQIGKMLREKGADL